MITVEHSNLVTVNGQKIVQQFTIAEIFSSTKFSQELKQEKHNLVGERMATRRDLFRNFSVISKLLTVTAEAAKNECQTPRGLTSPHSTASMRWWQVKCQLGRLHRITQRCCVKNGVPEWKLLAFQPPLIKLTWARDGYWEATNNHGACSGAQSMGQRGSNECWPPGYQMFMPLYLTWHCCQVRDKPLLQCQIKVNCGANACRCTTTSHSCSEEKPATSNPSSSKAWHSAVWYIHFMAIGIQYMK